MTAPGTAGVSEQLPLPETSAAEQEPPPPAVTVTVPVGDPTAGETGETVKATVTGWPKVEGEGESAVMIVDVFPFTTGLPPEALAAWTGLPP